jgi:hypothetical protein
MELSAHDMCVGFLNKTGIFHSHRMLCLCCRDVGFLSYIQVDIIVSSTPGATVIVALVGSFYFFVCLSGAVLSP